MVGYFGAISGVEASAEPLGLWQHHVRQSAFVKNRMLGGSSQLVLASRAVDHANFIEDSARQ